MHDSNPISKLLKFWPVVGALMAGAGSVTKVYFQVLDHERRIVKVEQARDEWIKKALERDRGRYR